MSIKHFYIQKFGGELFSDICFSAFHGLLYRGATLYETTSQVHNPNGYIHFFEESSEVRAHPSNMVIGSIESTRAYFKRLGITEPLPMNFPEKLYPMIKRKWHVATLQEFLKDTRRPVFIKPYNLLKAGTSGVLSSVKDTHLVLSDMPENATLIVSEVMDIVGEYRAFIRRGKIVGLQHYNKGGFLNFPDKNYINDCVRLMNESIHTPVGYTMDFAVLEDGDTQLVECNDGWSIGAYGLDGSIYVNLLIDRWMELLRQNNLAKYL